MVRDCSNPEWQYYDRHRRAKRPDWDSGRAKASSGKPNGLAQYNPYLYGHDATVKSIEMDCWSSGIEIPGHGTKYKQADNVVGVCSGVETEFVFAECTDGFVHGRPISKKALSKMGVRI